MRRRWLALCFVLPCVLHCSSDDPASEALLPDGGLPPDGGGLEADAPSTSPWGFDERPSNPTCRAPKRPPPRSGAGVKLARVYPDVLVDTPVGLVKRSGVPRWFVVEKKGRIVSFDDAPNAADVQVALDLRAKVYSDDLESGLLGWAFHPKFAQNGFGYAYYAHDGLTAAQGVRLSRFQSTDGGASFDPASEKVILDIHRGVQNHLGGHVVFGPDGFLYLGLGDGLESAAAQMTSGACDATGCSVFAGKLLRIDVDAGDPYGIPGDNPFAKGGGRPELFAWGLRNPWRYSFDRGSGALWLGDVGESSREEIDVVRAGGNYGWPLVEGTLCATEPCSRELVGPVFELAHPESHSLTGGYVYRGIALPQLLGTYVFGDFVTRKIWALVTDPGEGTRTHVVLDPNGPEIYAASFAETDAGEIIVVDYGTNGFYQLVANGPPPSGAALPKSLAETGCVDSTDPTKVAPGMIAYAINVSGWADGAEAERWFAIPDGTTIGLGADGHLDLPVGAVTMQTLRVSGKRIETRMMVRHDDGDWGGYAYGWNDAGTNATLLEDARMTRIGAQTWQTPSRVDCMGCHTRAAGRTLGLEVAQLDRRVDYPGRPGRDQLDTLVHAGFFSSPLARGVVLPALDAAAPAEARARSYLHVQCAMCHRPGAVKGFDLRFGTVLGATGTCDAAPAGGAMGIANARLLAPGDPERSLLLRRVRTTDVWQMPPLATRTIDTQGVALLSSWIAARTMCP